MAATRGLVLGVDAVAPGAFSILVRELTETLPEREFVECVDKQDREFTRRKPYTEGATKMGMIFDYGGNRPSVRHRRANYGDSAGTVSMRCLDCDKLRYVTPKELQRAARPRCLCCAGPLEEIDVSRKRRGLTKKAKLAIASASKKTPRCKACGVKVPDFGRGQVAAGLALHMTGSRDCLRYYVDSGYVREICGFRVIAGTERSEKVGSMFGIQAMLTSGAERVVLRNRTKRTCENIITGDEHEDDKSEHEEPKNDCAICGIGAIGN